MDDVFLFDPANARLLTPEYFNRPLLPKNQQTIRGEQQTFYKGRYILSAVLIAALIAVTVVLFNGFVTLSMPFATSGDFPRGLLFVIAFFMLLLWSVAAVPLLGGVLRRFTQVYDPSHNVILEQDGAVILGEVQAIQWIEQEKADWLTIRAHYPSIPDSVLYAPMPSGNGSKRLQTGNKIALLYSGVWGTQFYKVEVL